MQDIDREKALASPKRISNIVHYILEHFNQKTIRNDRSYTFKKVVNIGEVASKKGKAEEQKQTIRMSGFNSIFAVSSIDVAKLYYNEFERQMAELPDVKRLRIATIFSFGVNDDVEDGVQDENPEDTSALDQSSRDFREGD